MADGEGDINITSTQICGLFCFSLFAHGGQNGFANRQTLDRERLGNI